MILKRLNKHQFFISLLGIIGGLSFLILALPALAIQATQSGTVGTTIGTADSGANFFTPSTATIQVGETVTFTNSGMGFHNVDFDSTFPGGSVPDGFVADPASSAEWSRSVTFDKPGDYFFFCTPHRAVGMVGRITVEAETENIYLPLIARDSESR